LITLVSHACTVQDIEIPCIPYEGVMFLIFWCRVL